MTIILEQFSSNKSVTETQTYFKMVCDSFTGGVVQCSPCQGRDSALEGPFQASVPVQFGCPASHLLSDRLWWSVAAA